MQISLDEFRVTYVAPARARCAELLAEANTADAQLRARLEATDYDDAGAAEVEARRDDANRALARWHRRLNRLMAAETAQTDGLVSF